MNTLAFRWGVVLLLLCPVLAAHAQDDGLKVSLRVNYGAAYRDATWVPVDVVIENQEKDIEGHVEVTLYDANGDQVGPNYTVPAESPQFSRKRFRLHCYLEGVDRIRAQVYSGRRPVLFRPLSVQALPIAQSDFLCLVLDDIPENYGFLSTSLYGDATGRNIRFHRESLGTAELAFLADRLACYEAFDLIVMGEIDPGRISAAHRELLKQYVAGGGTLVVAFGAHAGPYKGSWVEEWLGVTLGNSAVYNGVELAEALYGDASGARSDREAFVTQMIPRDDAVRIRQGVSPVLEAARPYGNGFVIGLAIDAESQVLQQHPQYQLFWRRVAAQAYRPPDLNYALAASHAAARLPRVAGVELFPVSSVILYLVLYFAIAIVGNWLFWNHFKRRELAWVCLVFFSFGFTGYAMVFGTQGRAKATEIERIEVLELPANTETGMLRTLAGVLAAGSGRYSGSLENGDALVTEPRVDDARLAMNQGQRSRFSGPRPFTFVQAQEGRIEELGIGASEMRFLDIIQPLTLDGGITGELRVDSSGRLSGTLQNETGFTLTNPRLFHRGTFHTLRTEGNAFEIDIGATNTGVALNMNIVNRAMQSGGYSGDPRMASYEAEFLNVLFSEYNTASQFVGSMGYGGYGGGMYGGSNDAYRALSLPPCLVGKLEGDALTEIEMDQKATMNLASTLLVARVRVVDTNRQTAPRPLAVSVENGDYNRVSREDQSIPVGLGAWIDTTDIVLMETNDMLTVDLGKLARTWVSGKVQLNLYSSTSPQAVQQRMNGNSVAARSRYRGQNSPSPQNHAWRVKLRAGPADNARELVPVATAEEDLSGTRRYQATFEIDLADPGLAVSGTKLLFYPSLSPDGFGGNDQQARSDRQSYAPAAVISATATFVPAPETENYVDFEPLFD